MNAEKLTEEQLKTLFFEEHLVDEAGNDLFEKVEEDDWTDHGKTQSINMIFQDVKTGKHYRVEIIRSGSYYSHYEYECYDTPAHVEKKTKTITVERWVYA